MSILFVALGALGVLCQFLYVIPELEQVHDKNE